MSFYKEVDSSSRWKMQQFLRNHFRYNTMNSWNCCTSYACCMKLYTLDLPDAVVIKLYDLLDCEEAYERVQQLIDDFNMEHDYKWQAAFNGRSNGYLVLYRGGTEQSEYKSYCRFCGQQSYKSADKTDRVCGKCRRPGRINFARAPRRVVIYPGQSIDMDTDFREVSDDELCERVQLVQEFDKLADRIIAEAVHITENYSVKEEICYEPVTKIVLVETKNESKGE